MGNIINAGEEVFGRTKGEIKLKYNNNWWTQECEIAVQARRAKLMLKNYPTIENAARAREAENKAKKLKGQKKKNGGSMLGQLIQSQKWKRCGR